MIRTIRHAVAMLILAGSVVACEMSIDPSTGEQQMRLTLPGTAANAQVAQERWDQCTQFRSESFCERNLPGGRPVGVQPLFGGGIPTPANDP